MSSAPDFTKGYPAKEALVARRVVTWNSDGVEYADATTEEVLGVTRFDVASGDDASITLFGVVQVTVDGSGTAIAPGTKLMPKATADGVLVAHTGTAIKAATALEAATGSADVIWARLHTEQLSS